MSSPPVSSSAVAYEAWTSLAVPDWLNKGDNAWQMVSATLVGIQSMPGLVILYGSIVKKKWAVNSAFMALYAFAAVVICWVTWAYKMSFGEKLLPFWGKAGPALGQKFLIKQAALPATPHHFSNGALETAEIEPFYPMATMVWFQCVFAAIALVILAGSVLARMNFKAWMMFVPLWLTFSYTIGAFSLWGGGFLFHWGVMDYSGGYVIHLSSGIAGFTAAYWVGPRSKRDRERFPPNNVLLMLAGAGLLWLGWAGFNGGDPYAANTDSSMAVLNTNICAATSLLVWTWLDVIFFKKPSVIGAVQGMITGLVCITPGAVFHTHAVAGLLGGILTGLFAEPRLSTLFLPVTNSKGGVYGGPGGIQILKQIVGALFIIGWNLVATSIICVFINFIVPLRMTEEELLIGDDAVHGEEAYALWGDGENLSLYKDDTTHHVTVSSGATQVV
ncbi:ammonium transporter 3 member 1 isoform X2 [Vigna radiata var. radiata]|uniref:Ammonium transporter 3 member 1 isoform X2 n=1 Tax=Vigna radiata var. radiata TaxID=3916 RepID=A0A3Q0F8R2_VIGRR|nr:ammonium transporter 3 member 1 isoform X2 [Vigna radiata var. radiata]